MVARTLILFFITAAVLVGFVWLMPLDIVLKARGYTPEQIATVKQLVEPGTAALAVGASATQAGVTPAPQTQQTAQAPNTEQPRQVTQQSEQTTPADPAAQAAPASQAEPAPQPEPAQPRQFVSTDTVNVRAGQGTDTDVVGQLGPRTVVTVVEDPDGDWMKIESSEVNGWVYKPLFEPKK